MSKYKIFFITFFFLFLTSCEGKRDEHNWVVGISADNPPYQYSLHSGELIGFEIDLMEQIGRHLGKNIIFKNMDFQGLLVSLGNNHIDMIIAGMSVTPERMAKVDFSIPYAATSSLSIVFRKEDEFKNISDFKGKLVGAQVSTVWSSVAQTLSEKNDFKVKFLTNNLVSVEELKNSKMDAMIVEELQAKRIIKRSKALTFFPIREYVSSFAIALPKDSTLKKDIDNAIRVLQKNGTIDALYEKWDMPRAD